MKRAVIAMSLMMFFVTGCTTTLDVAYNLEKIRMSPLSSVEPLNIHIEEFADKRTDKDNICGFRNPFGVKPVKIVTKKPLPQIIREAFVAEFKNNGHLIGKGNNDISISGAITTFLFDWQPSWFYVECMGIVSVHLKVVNSKTGKVLISRTYQGNYNEKRRNRGGKGAWEYVMNIALKRMVRQVSTDPKFIKALQTIR